MKKINKLVFALAFAAAVVSCEDSYKIVQGGELGEEATFQTVDDVQSFLNGTYDQATIVPEIGFTAIFTDEAGIGNQSGGQNVDLYKRTLNVNDDFSDAIWLNQYTLINYTNRLLRGAGQVTPAAADVARYNSMLAEARVLRAFAHLELLTYYSEDMKNDNALGVIALDRVPGLEEDLARNTNAQCFALIESDLAFADANLVDHTGANAYKYVSRNMVAAIRARMYAYRGNYTLAEQYANAVAGITLTQAGTVAAPFNSAGYPTATNNFYTLAGAGPTNAYAKMWGDFAQGEIIFALSRPAIANQEQVAGQFYFNRTNLSGGPYHDMDYNLFNLLNDPLGDGNTPGGDHDIRRIAFVDPTSIIPSNPETPGSFRDQSVICIDKYRGKSGPAGSDLVNDLKVFRLSEMYLIRAEARVAAGDLTGAASIIKEIRDARTYTATGQPVTVRPLPVYASAADAWADVLKERRVELAFEGHRYIDLKRLGAAANAATDRFHRECEENNVPVCTLQVSDYRFTLPVPLRELLGNANIQQNTGY